MTSLASFSFFFFNDTATTEIYTLSLHDALPISGRSADRERGADAHAGDPFGDRLVAGPRERCPGGDLADQPAAHLVAAAAREDRKSTRLNSSHSQISYAGFCLEKKKTITHDMKI